MNMGRGTYYNSHICNFSEKVYSNRVKYRSKINGVMSVVGIRYLIYLRKKKIITDSTRT